MVRLGNKMLLMALLLSSAGCGASSNLFTLTTPHDDYASYEALLSKARAAYDRNELEEALKYGEKAYKLHPDSERASILYGLINLSLAGGDPFSLAKAMIENNKSKEAASSSTLALAASGTADALGSLKTVLGITDSELMLLGTLDETDPDLPVLIPNCAEGGREAVARLAYLNQAIIAACPFTDKSVRVLNDYRQHCDSVDGTAGGAAEANFLWAFSHLTEALTFNAVLTYGEPGASKTNLELRVDKLKQIDTATVEGINSLVDSVNSITATLDAVMPVAGDCSPDEPTSQIRATVNDLLAVDAAFQALAGIPDKVSKGIKSAMERIKKIQDSNTGGGSGQTQAVKKDFSKKIATSLAATIDKLGADPETPLSDAQKTKLCDSFTGIAPDPSISTVCSAD